MISSQFVRIRQYHNYIIETGPPYDVHSIMYSFYHVYSVVLSQSPFHETKFFPLVASNIWNTNSRE